MVESKNILKDISEVSKLVEKQNTELSSFFDELKSCKDVIKGTIGRMERSIEKAGLYQDLLEKLMHHRMRTNMLFVVSRKLETLVSDLTDEILDILEIPEFYINERDKG